MDEIRAWLYIGKYRDTLDKKYLDFKRIQSMLQLAGPINQQNINSLYLPVEDLEPTAHHLIRQGVDFILAEKEKGNKILVACGAGMNRSTAFCMAALKEVEGLSLLGAFKEIKRRRPESMSHKPVWESFCSYYNETTPYFEIMKLSI